jgi:hypothetical protein
MEGQSRVFTAVVAMAMALLTSACAASTSPLSSVQTATPAPTSSPTPAPGDRPPARDREFQAVSQRSTTPPLMSSQVPVT